MSSYSITNNINVNKLKTTSLISDKIILENNDIYEEFIVSMTDVKNKYDVIYPQLINLTNIVNSNNNNDKVTDTTVIDDIYNYIDLLLLYTEPDTTNIKEKDKHKEIHDKLDESNLLILEILNNLKNKADIDSLNSSNQQIKTINDQLTTLASTTDVEKTKSDIENIKTQLLSLADDGDIQTVNQKIGDINDQLTTLASSSDVETTKNDIDNIKRQLLSLASTTYVQELINDLDINAITTRITAVERDIITLNSNYDLLTQSSKVKIGLNAGESSQGNQVIAIGNSAGQYQMENSIAIGNKAGTISSRITIDEQTPNTNFKVEATNAIAIGNNAGKFHEETLSVETILGTNAIAIGNKAGTNQRENSIAIGNKAGTNQEKNSIAIGSQSGSSNDINIKTGSVIIGSDIVSDTDNSLKNIINNNEYVTVIGSKSTQPGGVYLPHMRSRPFPLWWGDFYKSIHRGVLRYDKDTYELYYYL